MPTKAVQLLGYGNKVVYKLNRTWERNGRGPRVPHAFSFAESYATKDVGNNTWSLTNGGAGTYTPNLTNLGNKLYAKMRDEAYTSLQVGADLGELHQTLSLIKGAVTAVRHPLMVVGETMKRIALHKKGRKDGLPLLKESSEALLAFQYGVKPLMQTVYDAMDILKDPFPKTKVRARVTSSGGERWDSDVGTSLHQINDIAWEAEMSGSFIITVTNPNLFAVEQLGLLNPASIAWELTPFSFVVDWFLPIGTYFASWSDYAGCTRTNPYTTSFTRIVGQRSRPAQGKDFCDVSVRCQRDLVAPTFKLSGIQMKTSMSVTHIINALALVLANAKTLTR